jgi:nicotinamide-nucleotide amidase
MIGREGRSAIVSVGDELLAGRVLDTNASWLSALLRAEGFPVALRLTVADERNAVADAVRHAVGAAEVVIVGGGLGPTKDDLTRDGIAGALALPLLPHAGALEMVRGCYAARGLAVPPGSEVQALLPQGFEPLLNRTGTAPGLLRRGTGGGLIAVLPGVPSELRAMAEHEIVPLLRAHPGRGPAPTIESLTIAGLREVDVGRRIADLMERGIDPVVGSYPKRGRVVLTVESHEGSPDEARERVQATIREIWRRLDDAVVGVGDLLLHEVVGGLLIERGTTVAVAESLTGGLVAEGLVSVPGISKVFLAGYVPYANRAKCDLLGVPEALIAAEGAVSEACARAMAEGARAKSGAAFALATTGIAGPSGGSPEKPVGTVWFALADAAGCVASRAVFPGDRESIRAFARERAFDLMRRRLLGLPLAPARGPPGRGS